MSQADQSSVTIPGQRAAEHVSSAGRLEVREWHRLGRRCLFVETTDGRVVGFLNVNSGVVTLTSEAERPQVEAAIADWFAAALDGPAPAPTAPDALPAVEPPAADPAPQPAPAIVDRAEQGPRAAARAAARGAPRRPAPLRSLRERGRGARTDERTWQVGAVGDEKVAARLEQLGPRWRVLHAIPAGRKEADAEHLVIGPGGVFLLTTKHHQRATMVVAGDTVQVNGVPMPHVRDSRCAAERVSHLLSRGCGFPVTVTGVLVPLELTNLTIREEPGDVLVLSRRLLDRVLTATPHVLADDEIARLDETARCAATWTMDLG